MEERGERGRRRIIFGCVAASRSVATHNNNRQAKPFFSTGDRKSALLLFSSAKKKEKKRLGLGRGKKERKERGATPALHYSRSGV